MIIRPLSAEDDLCELVELSRAFFAEYQGHHAEFFNVEDLRDDDILAFFSRSLGSEDHRTFLALDGGRIVGYITVAIRSQAPFYQVRRYGTISGLMVQPAYRRQGVARGLMAEAVAFFAERGVRYYTVYTAVANEGALRFYEQEGLAPLQTVLIGRVDPKARDGAS